MCRHRKMCGKCSNRAETFKTVDSFEHVPNILTIGKIGNVGKCVDLFEHLLIIWKLCKKWKRVGNLLEMCETWKVFNMCGKSGKCVGNWKMLGKRSKCAETLKAVEHFEHVSNSWKPWKLDNLESVWIYLKVCGRFKHTVGILWTNC